jgi:hypothetical protein
MKRRIKGIQEEEEETQKTNDSKWQKEHRR